MIKLIIYRNTKHVTLDLMHIHDMYILKFRYKQKNSRLIVYNEVSCRNGVLYV